MRINPRKISWLERRPRPKGALYVVRYWRYSTEHEKFITTFRGGKCCRKYWKREKYAVACMKFYFCHYAAIIYQIEVVEVRNKRSKKGIVIWRCLDSERQFSLNNEPHLDLLEHPQ